jgi:tetratricopeptide (TPR) repeat protein
MRLLRFDESGELVLTNFNSKPIPPYAILSHRWGDDEVFFQDIGQSSCKEKDGYQKIEFCARQAAQDQLQYFWVDTCCIDKWKRRELSAAINSMFRWYQNATKCYVYLSDVSVLTTKEMNKQSDWEASLRASEWFTRGWTLQELVAPRLVEFYSREGLRIGDKASLEQLIHEITGIPHTALQNCPLDRFSKKEKMRWAAHRETKEEEDIAYCLLGLLDISMSVSYGEGKEAAFKRLHMAEEGAAPLIIPYSRNARFVGQEPQLAELEAHLFDSKQTTTMAILGSGGTGKSQLALEFAYKVWEYRKNCSVFWIDASDTDSLHQGYWNIAQKLDLAGWDDETTDMETVVREHLCTERAGQWLLVFDGMDDIRFRSTELPAANCTDWTGYLPQSRHCSIILTTTTRNIAQRLAPRNIVELKEMAPDVAQTMFENCLNTPIPGDEQLEAKLLLQDLSYLPLAVVQAAAYINLIGTTLQEYRSEFIRQQDVEEKIRGKRRRGSRAEILENSSETSDGVQQEYGTRDPVAATLLTSVAQISRNSPLAAEYLCLAASVDRKDIPLGLLEASSPRERENAIEVLNRYALVTRRPAESALEIHRLVHNALRGWLRKQKQLDQWNQIAIQRLLKMFPDNSHGSRSKWRRMLPHARYALSCCPSDQQSTDKASLISKCALALLADGRYNESEELFVQVVDMSKSALGDEHPDTLTQMANLAVTYRNQGRWKEAKELATQVMEKRKVVLGSEDPDTLASMANVALILWNQGELEKAKSLGVQVLHTRLRVLGSENTDTLSSMANLAVTYMDLGQWNEAGKLNKEVVEKRTKVLGLEDRDTLLSMGNQARILFQQGRRKEAEDMFVQVVKVSTDVLGEEHPDTLGNMANLALVRMEQEQWEKATELAAKVMEIRKRVLGEKHPDTLTSLDNLAFMYWKQSWNRISKRHLSRQ